MTTEPSEHTPELEDAMDDHLVQRAAEDAELGRQEQLDLMWDQHADDYDRGVPESDFYDRDR